MVREVAPRVAAQSEPRKCALEQHERVLEVGIVDGNDRPSHSAYVDVMQRTGVIESQGARHAAMLARGRAPEGARSNRLCTNCVHPGARPRHVGSDPAWRRQTPSGSSRPRVADPEWQLVAAAAVASAWPARALEDVELLQGAAGADGPAPERRLGD